MQNKRTSGILMPISALPSKEGIGTLGENTFRFLDFLHESGQKIWQVLPLNPTNYGDSPYQSCSSNALNYYFIDLYALAEDGLLKKSEIKSADLGADSPRINYSKQFLGKIALLKLAFSRFDCADPAFRRFVKAGKYADFALFMALKEKFAHRSWTEWDEPYRTYDENVVKAFEKESRREILFWQFTQFVFLRQWKKVQKYAHKLGISIMGDIPLYIAYDSVEMWKYGNEIFRVNKARRPDWIAGVPPDAFSADGQLWGNPVYDWEKMQENGFAWWNRRIEDNLELFDILRIDHFRGFDRYFAIPFGATTARDGIWQKGPGEAFFADKKNLNIVAEDLGIIDDSVRELVKSVGYPGMRVLGFAFDGNPYNDHKPTRYIEHCVCYTGTHDNMPIRQMIEDFNEWELDRFKHELEAECKAAGIRASTVTAVAMTRSIVRLAFASKADTVIVPMWDVLAKGGEARINEPSTLSDKNWSMRLRRSDFTASTAQFLKKLAQSFAR